MLRCAGIDHMLVDKPRILFCNRVTPEVGIELNALPRGIGPVRRVQVTIRKFHSTARTLDHGVSFYYARPDFGADIMLSYFPFPDLSLKKS